MAVAAPAHTQAWRDNLMEGITNQIIEEHIKTREAMARNAIKFNKNVNNVQETLKLDYQTGTWQTWSGLTPYVANEQSDTIVANYTTGQYFDTITARPDLLERVKNDQNKTYDVIEEMLEEIRGRARVQLETELNQGDGSTTALNGSSSGTRVVGYRTVVPDSTTGLSVNGIATASHANYRPQVLDGDAGPSTDWDSDRVFMLGAMITRLSFSTNRAKLMPSLGLLSRDLANTMMEEMYDKFTPQEMDSSATAQFGFDNQVFLGPMGVKFMFDDNVASNTVEFWNMSPEAFEIWTPYENSLFRLMEHSGAGTYVGEPPIYELRSCLTLRWRQPRAFGKITNANAAASLTLL